MRWASTATIPASTSASTARRAPLTTSSSRKCAPTAPLAASSTLPAQNYETGYGNDGNGNGLFVARYPANDAYHMDGYMADFNYVDGKEEGSQKMWQINGKIRANYHVKNGERFGLIGLKKCYTVNTKDEDI